jgi:hypothetical protein
VVSKTLFTEAKKPIVVPSTLQDFPPVTFNKLNSANFSCFKAFLTDSSLAPGKPKPSTELITKLSVLKILETSK